jgi:hypothetical protein
MPSADYKVHGAAKQGVQLNVNRIEKAREAMKVLKLWTEAGG